MNQYNIVCCFVFSVSPCVPPALPADQEGGCEGLQGTQAARLATQNGKIGKKKILVLQIFSNLTRKNIAKSSIKTFIFTYLIFIYFKNIRVHSWGETC